jgi:hypothetical protein
MPNSLLRRDFLKLGAMATAAPIGRGAAGAARVLGASLQVQDLQSKTQVLELQARLPGLKYVDPSPVGRQIRLTSGADAVPESSPERSSFDASNDDSALRRFIDLAHEAGLKVFFTMKGWKRAGPEAPELMAVHIDGQPLARVTTPLFPAGGERDGISRYVYETRPPLCPNRPRVQRWKETLAAGIASTYEVEGITLRYSNFNQPGYYPGLYACWCRDCEAAAGKWGYDFAAMRAAMGKTLVTFSKINKSKLARIAQSETGFVGFLCELADSSAPAQWFQFRADSIMRATGAIRHKAEAAARLKGMKFGCMTFHPTFALLVGQRLADVSSAASFIVPQLLHWHVLHMQNFMALAEWFRINVKGLSEREALFTIYRLFGADGYPLPDSYAAMPTDPGKGKQLNHAALEPIIASELHRLQKWSGAVEIFPMLNSALWPTETRERLTDLSLELGAKAVWYQWR